MKVKLSEWLREFIYVFGFWRGIVELWFIKGEFMATKLLRKCVMLFDRYVYDKLTDPRWNAIFTAMITLLTILSVIKEVPVEVRVASFYTFVTFLVIVGLRAITK